MFPAPLEAWVVSYETKPAETKPAETFPSPLEAWVVSYFRRIRIPQILSQVSGPYRGLGSVLPDNNMSVFLTLEGVSGPYRGLGWVLLKQSNSV